MCCCHIAAEERALEVLCDEEKVWYVELCLEIRSSLFSRHLDHRTDDSFWHLLSQRLANGLENQL